MSPKKKIYYGIISVLIIAGWIAALVAYFVFKQSENIAAPVFEKIHFYNDPTTPIESIALKFVYAVPQDLAPQEAGLEEAARSVFRSVNSFHQLQFAARSQLIFGFYPDAITLPLTTFRNAPGNTLDEDTAKLTRMSSALEAERENNSGLDRHLRENPSAFSVTVIIHEGAGTAGARGVMMVPRTLLTEPEYAVTRTAVFYHMLGYALGLPSGLNDGSVASDDIMGSGKYLPLGLNYISKENLVKMGLFE